MPFQVQKYEKYWKSKNDLKSRLRVRSYKRFKYFSKTWNLTIAKNTNVNQRKCEHDGKINFGREKIHLVVTNDLFSGRKLRKVFQKKLVENNRF